VIFRRPSRIPPPSLDCKISAKIKRLIPFRRHRHASTYIGLVPPKPAHTRQRRVVRRREAGIACGRRVGGAGGDGYSGRTVRGWLPAVDDPKGICNERLPASEQSFKISFQI